MTRLPNVLYLHSHDTGRFVQPYGHQVPTPNIQRLADQGLLFRQAFAAAPVCSGSRAALLTGAYSHANGMLGLAHRGYRLVDYNHHLVHHLRGAGYFSALIGEQHVSADPAEIGYDLIVPIDHTRADAVAPATRALFDEGIPAQPFFLDVGFFETHRDYFEPTSVRDALYSLPPANLPDTPETRRDIAQYKASARSLDQGVGALGLEGAGGRSLALPGIVGYEAREQGQQGRERREVGGHHAGAEAAHHRTRPAQMRKPVQGRAEGAEQQGQHREDRPERLIEPESEEHAVACIVGGEHDLLLGQL